MEVNLRMHVQRKKEKEEISRRQKEKEESSRKGEVYRQGVERTGDGDRRYKHFLLTLLLSDWMLLKNGLPSCSCCATASCN